MAQPRIPNRKDALNIAFWFESSLIAVACLIGWFVEINPFANLVWDFNALLWGIVATIPLFLMFLLFYRYPLGSLEPIKNSLFEILGPLFSGCGWFELLVLAMVAGISEEILFRGVLQPLLEGVAGLFGGLVLSNVIFGMVHWITPMYAVIAGLIGIYLGLMMDIAQPRNLLIPIFIHALYDFLAFMIVARDYRARQGS